MIFLLKYWRYLAGLALIGLVAAWILSYGHKQYKAGAESVIAADAIAAAKQKAQWDAKELAYQSQLKDAQDEHATNLAELARLRAIPVPHVVCHAAPNPGSVPAVPGQASAGPAPTGEHPQSSPGEFDPTDQLYAAADAADTVIEQCRDALNKWPK